MPRYRLGMSRRAIGPLLACLGCAGALLVVVVLAFRFGPAQHLDAVLLRRLAAEAVGTGRGLATLGARLADPAPLALMLAVVVGLGLYWGRRSEALAAAVVVIGANVTTQLLKPVFEHHRVQPFLGGEQLASNSFPSGHATAAASIAVALLLVAPPRLRAPAAALGVALVAVVGSAVVALEWHYPSDALGGIIVAAGWGFAALAVLRQRRRGEDAARAARAQASRRFAISTK